jgi:serine protease Do
MTLKPSEIPSSIFLFIATLALFLSFILSAQSVRGDDRVSRETAIVRAIRMVSPAVVNISTSKVVEGRVNPFFSWEHNDLFDRFFRDFFEPHTRQYVQNSLGSGVIIDSSHRYVLTNHHVIVRASKIRVTLSNQQEFEARAVGTDPESDLAILKIETSIEVPAIPMGRSDDLMIGETVIAIGNPFGLSH